MCEQEVQNANSGLMLYAGWSCEQLLGEDVHGKSTRNDRNWFAGFGWRVW